GSRPSGGRFQKNPNRNSPTASRPAWPLPASGQGPRTIFYAFWHSSIQKYGGLTAAPLPAGVRKAVEQRGFPCRREAKNPGPKTFRNVSLLPTIGRPKPK